MIPVNNATTYRSKEAQLPYIRFLLTTMALLVASFLIAFKGYAQEEDTGPTFAYIGLEPDIVTNYAGDNSKKLGYVRVTIEMMVSDTDAIPSVEHHMPLLRATAIEVFGAQNEDRIRSLTGREDIRRQVLQQFRDIMKRETGDDVIEDIIFTKYLRQGG